MDQDPEIDKELKDLWGRRNGLSREEWKRLCILVQTILSTVRCRELSALRDRHDPESLIQDFIVDKVLTSRDSQCHGASALYFFFRNYLRDRLRSHMRLDNHYDDSNEGLPPPDATTDPNPGIGEVLREAGLSVEQVRQAACQWLSEQEEWVILYLGRFLCPEGDRRLPLSRLAKTYNIRAYHHKAMQLGLVWGHNNPRYFRGTKLGQWLTTLGLDIEASQWDSLKAALQILCLTALSMINRPPSASGHKP